METIAQILRHYRFGPADEEHRQQLAKLLLPESDRLAEEFYRYLEQDAYTAGFFRTEEAVRRRKETLKAWLEDLLTARYDNAYLRRLQRVGRVHVRIRLRGHYVNAAMSFIRDFCRRVVVAETPERPARDALVATLDKILDMNLDVLTGSYREEELRQVFLSYRVESALIRWAERLLHGLNLVLTLGLLAMAVGVVCLFAYDVFHAFTADLEKGVITALGSLLVLWMMIELLHAEVRQLRGGQFQVRVLVELALVAFIRKLFVAALEHSDPVDFGLLLAALLVLGVIFFLVGRSEARRSS